VAGASSMLSSETLFSETGVDLIESDAADSCWDNLMNKFDTEPHALAGVAEGINLGEFLKANESEIRWQVESLVLERVTRAIGRENLAKISLSFRGSALDNFAVHVEGPDDLKAMIELAFSRTPPTKPITCGPILRGSTARRTAYTSSAT
jgi:hypothetical protein